MGILSIFSKKWKESKLTKLQLEEMDKKVEETIKRYSQEEKLASPLSGPIAKKIEQGNLNEKEKGIVEERKKIEEVIQNTEHAEKNISAGFVKTGILGFDDLLEKGIPGSSSILLCGGPGSGKTIMGLQILNHHASLGKKCVYLTFEESEEKLRQHMRDFRWDIDKLEKEGNMVIIKYGLYSLTRRVEALLEKAKGELLIDVNPVLFPENFVPEFVVIDSLTAVASAFYGREDTYRIYVEQLFRLLEQVGATSFLITESTQIPVKLTESGVEEFLADGVIILYNIKSGNIRESAIEVLKLRGASFQKKIVAMKVEAGKGIVVYPEQEVFGGV